jgi:CBS domain-containing protein
MIDLDDVPLLDPDEEAADALAKLIASPVSHGLVTARGRLAGILSLSDIARALQAPPRQPSSAAVKPPSLAATPH